MVAIALVCAMPFFTIFGALSDKIGRKWLMMLACLLAVTTYLPIYHAMQRAAGSELRMQEIGPRLIRDHLPDQHREFFEQLPALLVGSVDALQRPWASLLTGRPGFITTPDAQHLRVAAFPMEEDPLHAQLRIGGALGLLGIEPHTRRRNRVNGQVVALGDHGFGGAERCDAGAGEYFLDSFLHKFAKVHFWYDFGN